MSDTESQVSQPPLASYQGSSKEAMGRRRLASTDVKWVGIVVRVSVAVHLCVGAAVLIVGMARNGGRKYVKADLQALVPGCSKGYVDVWAESSSDDGAYVCCDDELEDDGMCSSMVYSLPLGGRLTKLPDSWIIPLIPLLLFLIPPLTGSVTFAGKRSLFYVAIMLFRVLVLFLLFNKIEDSIGSSSDSICWYLPYMTRGTCYGRDFDFSDHVVFFYVHLLLIPLVEVLCGVISIALTDDRGVFACVSSFSVASALKSANLLLRVLFVLYMEFLVITSVLRTSVYFHTVAETIVGYLIGLMVQLPIFFMLCNVESTSVKNFLGIPGLEVEHED